MNKLQVAIVDDEPDSATLLQLQLERHCPSINQIISFTNPIEALQSIPKLNPDIVFMDIEMPLMNGFQLLEQLSPLKFNVIFITAFNQYAIRAFRFNALDYLLKPADIIELKNAVSKAENQLRPNSVQLTFAEEQFKGNSVTRLALPSQEGITFVNLSDIIYVEASNNYSRVFLADNSTYLLSKTLKDVQELLEGSHFLRVHRQYLVNLNRVRHFNRNEGQITMDAKQNLPIARNQYERFMEKYYRI